MKKINKSRKRHIFQKNRFELTVFHSTMLPKKYFNSLEAEKFTFTPVRFAFNN